MAEVVSKTLKLSEIKGLTGLDIRALSDIQLRQALHTATLQVHTRQRQLERAGLQNISKAYDTLRRKYPGGISQKGVTSRGQLERMLKAGIHYLNSQTGTVSGTRAFMRKVYGIVEGEDEADKLKDKDIEKEYKKILEDEKFWEKYRKTQDEYIQLESTTVLQTVYDVYTKETDESKMSELIEARLTDFELEDLGITVTSTENLTDDYLINRR